MKIRNEFAGLTREQVKLAIHDVMEQYSGNFTEVVEKVRELLFVMDVLSQRNR